MIEEENIIKRILDGNQEEFRKIVEIYQNYIFAICFNILKDRQEAENITQETFIKIYSSLKQYEFSGLKTWIGRIATNKCIDLKRKKDREIKNNMTYLEDIENRLQSNYLVEEDVIRKEEIKRVLDCCDEIPEKYGKIIKKYYLDSQSYKEIAHKERISVKIVESRLYRGKKLLRKKLKGGGAI